jgi:HEPN domain-containing protein
MNKIEHVKYWIDSSRYDLQSMDKNFQSGTYDWALFIGHLSLEKILKALWIRNNEGNFPAKTHNLKKLADEAKAVISETDSLLLLEINDFNLEARYPDYKFEFYKKCTKNFSESYIEKIKELHACIASQI